MGSNTGIEKVKVEVTEYRWKCPGCGQKLAQLYEASLLKLIERHQAKDERLERMAGWRRDVKAHIGKVNSK